MDNFLLLRVVKSAKMPVLLTTVFLVFGIILMSCYKITPYKNQNNLMKLKKGLAKEDVINIMGKPNFHEVYESLYGNTLMILYYYTHRNRLDGKITKDECTPVVIKNDKLVGWGDDFYEWLKRREKKINHQ
jgi:outer membrane protein assembly factor BamE (lipoprotein component of BamABCDE complex)